MRFRRYLALTFLLGTLVWTAAAQSPSFQSFEDALIRAQRLDRPVLVDVWAPWCGWCHRMKREVYPSLPDSLKEAVVWTRLNRDDGEKYHRYRGRRLPARQLAKELGAEGVPALVFLSPDGQKLFKTAGFLPASQLRPVLLYVATGAYRRITYAAFKSQQSEVP